MLLRLTLAGFKRNPAERLKLMMRLADAKPANPDAQEFAAREAWQQGQRETAVKYAERGIRVRQESLAVLKILAESSIESGQDDQAYEYAKRLLAVRRIDKEAEPWLRVLLTPFRMIPKYRARFRDFFDSYVPKNDEWIHWAKEYVDWYESRAQPSRPNT